jgi:hypothetical protein
MSIYIGKITKYIINWSFGGHKFSPLSIYIFMERLLGVYQYTIKIYHHISIH